MEKSAKIYVAGHRGLVGSALMRALTKERYANIVTRTHAELDLALRESSRPENLRVLGREDQPRLAAIAILVARGVLHRLGEDPQQLPRVLGVGVHVHRTLGADVGHMWRFLSGENARLNELD